MSMANRSQAQFDASRYCIPGAITVHEVLDMKRAFDMIDEDASGVIDAEELQGAAAALGIPMEENIQTLLGNEKLPFEEFFKRMTAKLEPSDKADDIMAIFELFDNDATGTVSLENLQNIGRIIGAKESAKEIQEMLSTLDTDGDGVLCPIDFYTCLVSGMRIRMEEEKRNFDAQAEQMEVMQGGGGPGASRMSGTSMSGGRMSGSRMGSGMR
jgi:Ca2+-binding EF-hand superfamily protein